MSERRLRVGIDRRLTELPDRSGHGKVWNRVLAHLDSLAKLVPLDFGGRRQRLGRRLDVFLADGHAPLPDAGKIPVVAQIHEAAWFEPELTRLLDPAFVAQIAPTTEASIREATRLIVPSEAARRDIARDFDVGADGIDVAHHGVDDVFAPGVVDQSVATLAGSDPYVLFAAMIHPRKNLAAVREAMNLLAEEGYPHKLAIVGGPATDRPDSRQLEQDAVAELPAAPGRVIRFPELTDRGMAAVMGGAEAFCLPSLYEGFGLTVLEAMACATVPVVSDRGALPEVVGDTGIVVEPTGSAVCEGLEKVIANDERARDLGAAAQRRASGFTWERAAHSWLRSIQLAVSSS